MVQGTFWWAHLNFRPTGLLAEDVHSSIQASKGSMSYCISLEMSWKMFLLFCLPWAQLSGSPVCTIKVFIGFCSVMWWERVLMKRLALFGFILKGNQYRATSPEYLHHHSYKKCNHCERTNNQEWECWCTKEFQGSVITARLALKACICGFMAHQSPRGPRGGLAKGGVAFITFTQKPRLFV